MTWVWIVVGIIVVFAVVVVISSVKVVHQATAAVIERLGRFQRVAEPGLTLILPFIDQVRRVIDLREQVIDLPPNPVITKDNVTVNIDTVLYYQITDPIKVTYEIANLRLAIEQLTVTTLRSLIGEMELDQSLYSREQINSRLRVVLDEATDSWGVKVNRVELKNIEPPEDIQQAMEKQMRAERDKRAAILTAEGEKQAAILRAEGEREAAIRSAEGEKQSAILRAEGQANALRTTQQAQADAIRMVFAAIHEGDPTPELLAVRYLETLGRMAEGEATKIVVPYESSALLGALSSLQAAMQLPSHKTPSDE
ncbi:MAG: SPFH/Band 7/PHB domain protein [Firmicutes bacterium]|nr:SPFH/Band 7/PHB domain protein [Bacillota bacterium]